MAVSWRGLAAPLVLAAAVALAAGPAAGGGIIGVNFVGKNGYTPPMGSGEQAGVDPQARWNNAAGSTGSNLPLLDALGDSTEALLEWRGLVSYTGITDTPGNARLMRGCLTPLPGEPLIVKVAGLEAAFAGGAYDLIVYFDGDNKGQNWVMRFTVGGASVVGTDLAGVDFGGTFTRDTGSGGNYVRFEHLTGNTFTLSVEPAVAGVGSVAVSGLQLVHAPEPATLALACAGLAAALLRRRRRKA